ncbi:hypothetical protein B0H66DRAFT_587937 [Apodospora peruviana]|uniref:RlpA-like protein double-psi beta-barrel domain-containing protein n=1 Tax=Apodospora peruviana TaxID=516989 RepID=A0AAE0IHI9_9PEZI|nr:hypothetical protein B0H66DRAFT_587937 [Apodospora peruviana]
MYLSTSTTIALVAAIAELTSALPQPKVSWNETTIIARRQADNLNTTVPSNETTIQLTRRQDDLNTTVPCNETTILTRRQEDLNTTVPANETIPAPLMFKRKYKLPTRQVPSEGILSRVARSLHLKRAFEGEFTFYSPAGGVGACGTTIADTDFAAALSASTFGEDTFDPATGQPTNPNCGRRLRASVGDKSVEVTVVDKCAGCQGAGDLDLTPAAFQALTGSLDSGRVSGSWDFI